MGKPCPQSHVVNLLRRTPPNQPTFTLFLGAGASVTSGVRAAGALIEEWRKQHFEIHGEGGDIEEYLRKHRWYKQPTEYSDLFEAIYDFPAQRRQFIEREIESARPSWGYIYLVNLLRNKVINTVFTTNFDDLVNEACYQCDDDLRPIVCAHDSGTRSIRMTNSRPKIIKLHGDFLFDDIKNTMRELESLDQNMRQKFKQFASEFGMIVVGYSGRDRSVMSVIDSLMRAEGSFPHGIYWGLRPGEEPSEAVRELTKFDGVRLFTLDGFDEFFADVNDKLGLQLPPKVADPYGSLAKRLNELANSKLATEKKPHGVILRDCQALGQTVAKVTDVIQAAMAAPKTEAIPSSGVPIPYEFLAYADIQEGRWEKAVPQLRRALEQQPRVRVYEKLFKAAKWLNDKVLAREFVDVLSRNPSHLEESPGIVNNISLCCIDLELYDEAIQILDLGRQVAATMAVPTRWSPTYYYINRAQVKRHRGEALSTEERVTLSAICARPDPLERLGASIVLEDAETMSKVLQQLMADGTIASQKYDMQSWPIFRLIKADDLSSAAKDALEQIRSAVVRPDAEEDNVEADLDQEAD